MDERTVAGYWDGNAPAWVEGVRAGHDVYREYVNNPAFFGMLGDVADTRIVPYFLIFQCRKEAV